MCFYKNIPKNTVCEDFPDITNSDGHDFTFENQRDRSYLNPTEISHRCQSGFIKKGSTLTCDKSGKWVGEVACIPSEYKNFCWPANNERTLNNITVLCVLVKIKFFFCSLQTAERQATLQEPLKSLRSLWTSPRVCLLNLWWGTLVRVTNSWFPRPNP